MSPWREVGSPRSGFGLWEIIHVLRIEKHLRVPGSLSDKGRVLYSDTAWRYHREENLPGFRLPF